MKNNIDKNVILSGIEYLKNTKKVIFDPYPNYDKEVFDILSSLGEDFDYQNRYHEIEKKDINNMNLDDLRTIYTFYRRGERFSDGFISQYIEDGSLLKLALRELELLEDDI